MRALRPWVSAAVRLVLLGAALATGAVRAAPAAPPTAPAPTAPAPATTAPATTAPATTVPVAPASFTPVSPGNAIVFPRDFGSHPQFRTEWWYVTGWLMTAHGEPLGFQVTFFRTRPGIDESNPSTFTPHQLLIAHAALSDPHRGRLWQDQTLERAGFGRVEAREGDTAVRIDRWRLERAEGVYHADLDAEEFALHLEFKPTQPPLLEGTAGVSRKGPDPLAASYYYSLPHLAVTGSIRRQALREAVTGEAWFDHEWSSEYLDPLAVGWDWTGINLDDGASLMAFRIRGLDGSMRWAGATWRAADGTVSTFDASAIRFEPLARWRSPRTGTVYPVRWHLTVGPHSLDLEPLLEDQENDTRLSTGAIYWEGAVRALEAGRVVGRGYLELTGYAERLRLR
jgi:predicted secreted hydrolase